MGEMKKVLLVAHRGASKIAPENTLKSFQSAIDLKADYIEFDVRQTKDGEIVVIHDGNTYRTSKHFGRVKNMLLNDLKQLDFGNGEKIPTLKELINLAKGKLALQCEIKIRGISKKVVEILRESNVIETSKITSFKHDILKQIKKIEPIIKIGALEPTRTGWIAGWFYKNLMIKKVIKNNFNSIHLLSRLITKSFIKKAHNNNIEVIVWAVNSESRMKRLIAKGVDGIVTNDVELAKKVLNRE